MEIHAIQTGTVRIKARQRIGRGPDVVRQLGVFLGRQWTEPLPIYAWAIETADGVVVVDTGETAQTREAGYFPAWHPYFRLAVRVDVTPEQEIGPQLLNIGIRAADVRTVILTHLHTDHAGGLRHFPASEILVSEEEHRLARGFAGRLRGYLPNRWPSWFKPQFIPFEPIGFGPFNRAYRVTRDDTVFAVPTPGHTPGHVSVIVQDSDVNYFLAGDATYTLQALLEQKVDGVSPAKSVSLRTLSTILRFAQDRPTVYLPAHDPESAERLKTGAVIHADAVGSALSVLGEQRQALESSA